MKTPTFSAAFRLRMVAAPSSVLFRTFNRVGAGGAGHILATVPCLPDEVH